MTARVKPPAQAKAPSKSAESTMAKLMSARVSKPAQAKKKG